MNGPAEPATQPLLSARGLHFQYDNEATLHDVHITASRGEVVGIIGPNGAGKSTLLLLMAGLLSPAAGTLNILGQTRLTDSLRRRIAFLPDNAALYDELTGLENVQLFAGLRGHSGPHTDASTLGKSLGLTAAEMAAPVSTYSFGMKRKVALAQTLIGATDLLLLDEPTIGLDPNARDDLAAALNTRCSQAAVLLASNDLGFVQEHCDRVVILAAGTVVLTGKPADLIAPLCADVHIEIGFHKQYRPIDTNGFNPIRVEIRRLKCNPEQGSAALPALIDTLLRAGNEIETIDIRRPGLNDVFRHVTGAEWKAVWPPG